MNTSQQHVSLSVQGMTCRSCATRVQKALIAVPGVESASVDLAAQTVIVTGNELETKELVEAVQDAGYTASAAPEARPSRSGQTENNVRTGCCK